MHNKAAHTHDVEFRRLFLIAKAILHDDPNLDNFEWCERIKDRLVQSGLGYPENPSGIHDAMRAVEAVTPRPAPVLRPPAPPIPEPPHEEPTPEGLAIRNECMDKVWHLAQTHTMPVIHGPTQTAKQIDGFRREQFAQRQLTHVKTAKGWAPIVKGDE